MPTSFDDMERFAKDMSTLMDFQADVLWTVKLMNKTTIKNKRKEQGLWSKVRLGEIPEPKFSDDALKKRMEKARKMFRIFDTIGKEKITRDKLASVSYDYDSRATDYETYATIVRNTSKQEMISPTSYQSSNCKEIFISSLFAKQNNLLHL
ncbi:hypothetical protein GLOIN_2v1834454 [Rhizophagus clarus]|uniref:EF-hand domain-containing protein n=1 Tax=Rhizophagus clarus TaxID=94130 RepID=A0A8H3QPE4_9GLOM|nr:hypothetical protein GLOIN_2v1834454 [Rhizophagus clarus]